MVAPAAFALGLALAADQFEFLANLVDALLHAAAVGLQERWRADGRWFHYIEYLEEGGRTLTRAHLVVKARRR